MYTRNTYRLSWFYYADMLSAKSVYAVLLRLCCQTQLGNSELIVNLSPKLSFFLIQCSPCTFGFLPISGSTLAKPVPVNLYQLILTLSPTSLPSLLPTWLYSLPNANSHHPWCFICTFFFSCFVFLISKSSESSYVHSTQGERIKKKKYVGLLKLQRNSSGQHLINI